MTTDDLITLFSRFGAVKNAGMVEKDGVRGSKGFAFVEMATEDEAEAAIHALNGSNVQGRLLTVARDSRTEGQIPPSNANAGGTRRASSPNAQGEAASALPTPMSSSEPPQPTAVNESELILNFLLPARPEKPSIRQFPVRVYLSNPLSTEVLATEEALNRMCDALDCSFEPLDGPEIGSWFRRFFARTKELLTHEELLNRARLAEQALKIRTLEGPQAQADGPRLTGAAELLAAIGTNNAVVQIGSVLLVKLRSHNPSCSI